MKWYFASRTRHQYKLASLSKQLEEIGEIIESTWVYIEDNLIPFTEHIEATQKLAVQDIDGVLRSDILVLISDPSGTDMFAEFGAALAKKSLTPNSIRIYIVGEHSTRSLIQLHPAVVHLSTIQEVFQKEKLNYTELQIPDFK